MVYLIIIIGFISAVVIVIAKTIILLCHVVIQLINLMAYNCIYLEHYQYPVILFK